MCTKTSSPARAYCESLSEETLTLRLVAWNKIAVRPGSHQGLREGISFAPVLDGRGFRPTLTERYCAP